MKRVLRKELAPTVTGAVGRVFTDYIVRPYQQVCDEYVERSQMEQQLLFERVDMAIKSTANSNVTGGHPHQHMSVHDQTNNLF